MELLSNFQAPSFTRIIWHNSAARDKWSDRIQEIDQTFMRVERQSILQGIRGVSLQPLSRLEFRTALEWATQNGLKVRIVQSVRSFEGFSQSYTEGDDFYITAISNTQEALENPEKYLGYPKCCEKFFYKHFPKIIDPIWQWAGEKSELGRIPIESNPLLRYMNIRFLPHIPCNPNCQESVVLGKKMKALYPTQTTEWMDELLSLPITWDCYRGVVIVKTPLFRIVTGSVPTRIRYLITANQGK